MLIVYGSICNRKWNYIIYAYNEDSVSVSKNKFDISNAKREIYVYVVWEIV